MKRVGERVSRHLPDSGLRYEFLLYHFLGRCFSANQT
jgi:hypothetical protein